MSKITLAVVVAPAVGGGAYAFTASNTVPATTAGAGSGSVSGFTVTDLHYSLDATTPTIIDSLTFTITRAVPIAGTGKVVISAGPTTYMCSTDTTETVVTCGTVSPQLTAALLTGVTVVAAQWRHTVDQGRADDACDRLLGPDGRVRRSSKERGSALDSEGRPPSRCPSW